MPEPAISVIIPVYNEEAFLPRTLDHLFAQPNSFEVIVVDGGSTDRTLERARSYLSVRAVVSPKGRAVQMNLGAQAARGQVFLFLHADALLPMGAFTRISQLVDRVGPDWVAGAFWHAFDEQRFSLKVVSLLDNLRCWWTRVPYGDQAIFVGRELFWRLGGFDDRAIVEDLEFSKRLRRVGPVHLLGPPVRASARKCLAMGTWRALGRCLAICARDAFGLDLSPAAKAYFKDIR